ncbi:MAG: 4Fe-4S binding protein [Slackia sp.]
MVIDGTKCSSCRMCATFCPTGAIRVRCEDGTYGRSSGRLREMRKLPRHLP